jgi:hypothetical protein
MVEAPTMAPSSAPPQKSQGAAVTSTVDLKPDAEPGKTAEMVMAGTHIPVSVSIKREGDSFEILLRAHNETFEREAYKTSPGAFSLKEAASETYWPELDLIRFPMHVGDDWDWRGTVSAGGVKHDAQARIKTSSTHLYQDGASTEAIQVEVDLIRFSKGTKTPAERKLVFDFVQGKGIVRREFGDASVRQPEQP